jgi:hypothetical protein
MFAACAIAARDRTVQSGGIGSNSLLLRPDHII